MEVLAGVIFGLLLIIILSGLYLLWEKHRYFGLLFLSLLLVLGSLHLPKTFNDINELSRVGCGWPLPFVESSYNRDLPLPWRGSCRDVFSGGYGDWGLINFFWLPFLVDIGLVFGFLYLGYSSWQKISLTQKRQGT